MEHLERTLDVKEGGFLPFVWENSDVMTYAKLERKYLDAKRLEALASHGWASKIVYEVRSCATVYKAWCLRQKEWVLVRCMLQRMDGRERVAC